jgi:DNA-binding MarR family transcriptional regulator
MTEVRTGALPQSDAVDARPAAGLTILLKHAEQAVKQRLQPLLDDADLTLDHWRIISVLLVQPGLTMTTIADSAVVPAATLTRLTDKLAERAVIVRRVDVADKRRVVVALSPLGEQLANRLRAAEAAVITDLAGAVGDQRVAALLRELAVLPHVVT